MKNKVVFITGSSSGIGKAIAILFAKKGANIIISSHSNFNDGEKVLKELQKIGGNHMHINCDLSRQNEVKNAFEKIKAKYGRLDILINNAGFSSPERSLSQITEDGLDKVLGANIKSLIWCSQFAVPLMNKGGQIINTSSIRGLDYAGKALGYSCAKSAVNSLTKTLALELAQNILVNAVLPGSVSDTKIYNSRAVEVNEAFAKKLPLKKSISASEIANCYLFLATQNYLTGTLLLADGGMTLLSNWMG